jgi:hypothetical protein
MEEFWLINPSRRLDPYSAMREEGNRSFRLLNATRFIIATVNINTNETQNTNWFAILMALSHLHGGRGRAGGRRVVTRRGIETIETSKCRQFSCGEMRQTISTNITTAKTAVSDGSNSSSVAVKSEVD